LLRTNQKQHINQSTKTGAKRQDFVRIKPYFASNTSRAKSKSSNKGWRVALAICFIQHYFASYKSQETSQPSK
jgi:hypothetical protein